MLIRMAIAISDKNVEKILVSKLIGLSIVLKDEFDISIYSDCFEKLCDKIHDIDILVLDVTVLSKFKELLSNLYLRNQKCLPILLGNTGEDIKNYLNIRPIEHISDVSIISPESETDKVKQVCKLYMSIVNKDLKEKNDNKVLYITTKQDSYAIPKDTILFCQSDLKYTVFVLENGMLIRKLEKLQDIENKYLWDFKRVHQSFLINPHKIKSLDKVCNEIVLINDARIPFSRKYSSAVHEMFKN